MNDINRKVSNFGKNIFFLAAFFLPSALPISGILLLISTIIYFSKNSLQIKKDRLGYLFGLVMLLMLISCIYCSLNTIDLSINSLEIKSNFGKSDKINIWLDLLNWYPFFFFYWAFQKYLTFEEDRIKFAKFIFMGTMPVIVSCLLQYWFKIYGPFEFLFGTIVWFQKPISFGVGVSGLFSNQNYAGAWLATTLPFSFFLILKNKNFLRKKILTCLITIIYTYVLILTDSRNALIGLLISLIFIFGFQGIWIMLLGIFFIFLISLSFSIFNPLLLNEITQNIFSNQLFIKITNFDLSNFISYPRVEIINISTNLISNSPIFGYGAGTFPKTYLLSGGIWDAQHTHNMPLQIAYNYGIPTAIALSFIFLYVLVKSYKKIFLGKGKSPLIDKCWFISSSIIVLYNFSDFTYYDGKISILIWLLFSGLNCIGKNESIKQNP